MGFKIIFITFPYFPKCENTKYAVFDYLMLSTTRNFPVVPSLFACSWWKSSTLYSFSLWRLLASRPPNSPAHPGGGTEPSSQWGTCYVLTF